MASNRMRIHKIKEKESSQLTESLSQFGNVKNEFIVSGRKASKNLIQERRFDEAVRVCEMVLAVDPDDIETGDLKERAIVYLNNPDQFDLNEMQNVIESTPQRLLRSASERRSRKTDGGSIIVGLTAATTPAGKPSDKNNNATNQGSEHISEQPVKLRRTRSELHRPNVLERIKEFEKQAKNRTNGALASNRLVEQFDTSRILEIQEFPTIPTTPNEHRTMNQSFFKGPTSVPKFPPVEPPTSLNIIEIAAPSTAGEISPSKKFPAPRLTGHYFPSNSSSTTKSNLLENQSYQKCAVPSFLKLKTETLPPVSEVETPTRKPTDGVSFRQSGNAVVKWTDVGISVSANLRSQLESNFFTSPLIRKACIVSTKSEVLVSFGWNHIRKQEFDSLLSGMASQSYLTSSILRLDGIEFRCLSGTGTVVRARVKKLGVNCTKLNNLLVITVYEHPVLPKEVAMLVKRLGEFLSKIEA